MTWRIRFRNVAARLTFSMPTITEVDRYIVPFLQPEERPGILGTGIFCVAGDQHFLVTAAHVTDEGDTGFFGNGFFLSPETTRLIETSLPASGRREDDRIDVAVLLLSAEAGQRFRAHGREPLGIDQWNVGHRTAPGQNYVFTGFTHSDLERDQRRRQIEPRRVSADCPALGDDELTRLGLDPRFHIAVNYQRRRMVNQHGNMGMGPEPAGMSGGPVWTRDPNSENLRWVGVGIEHWREHQLLVGTRIGAVIYLLRETVPELRDTLPLG